MKKLMIATAALCAAVSVNALESANIVGYSTKEAAQGRFIILGAQFDNVDGARKVNGMISGVEGVAYDSEYLFMTTAAQIQVPNTTGGYNTYYYLTDGYYENEKGEEAYAPGWCDGFGTLVDDELTTSIAMWLRSTPGNATANVSGAVSDLNEVSVSCPTIFALRANAFPMAITLNTDQMTSANIVGVAYDNEYAFMTSASQLQVPNTTGGYNTYYYLTDGYYEDEKGEEAYAPGWCDGFGTLVDDVIPVAQGFWTKGVSGAFTLTFTK